MSRFIPNPTPCGRSRREFLWQMGGGFAGLALADLLYADGVVAGKGKASSLAARTPQLPAKAKHCVFLFMNGGPSQVDTFDPKPLLTKFHVHALQGRREGRLQRPGGRVSDEVAVRVRPPRAERTGDQQPLSAPGPVCR